MSLDAPDTATPETIDLRRTCESSGVAEVLRELDEELIGPAPVKQRIRETAALLRVDRARREMGLAAWTISSPQIPASARASPITSNSYTDEEPERIATAMLDLQNYHLDKAGRAAMADYVALRRAQPHFANARSIRNALDRTRLRQANRLFETAKAPLNAAELGTITERDIRTSRVFTGGLDIDRERPS
jgi:hypothetical protein